MSRINLGGTVKRSLAVLLEAQRQRGHHTTQLRWIVPPGRSTKQSPKRKTEPEAQAREWARTARRSRS